MEKQEEKSLTKSITSLTKLVKQLRSERYLQMIENKKKFLFYGFLSGMTRGIGFALGSTLIFALTLWVLSQLISMPFLGDWIARLINYIQQARVPY